MKYWIPLIAAVVMGLGGWAMSHIVGHGRKIAVHEQRLDSLEDMKAKLDQVAEDTAAIRVSLGEPPHV